MVGIESAIQHNSTRITLFISTSCLVRSWELLLSFLDLWVVETPELISLMRCIEIWTEGVSSCKKTIEHCVCNKSSVHGSLVLYSIAFSFLYWATSTMGRLASRVMIHVVCLGATIDRQSVKYDANMLDNYWAFCVKCVTMSYRGSGTAFYISRWVRGRTLSMSNESS